MYFQPWLMGSETVSVVDPYLGSSSLYYDDIGSNSILCIHLLAFSWSLS